MKNTKKKIYAVNFISDIVQLLDSDKIRNDYKLILIMEFHLSYPESRQCD